VTTPDETPFDALYGAPLEEFTARRDAAAKAAKLAGDPALAARLKAARKPSVTAWVSNHVVRSMPDALAALLSAGQALRLEHARMVHHGEAPGMRHAMDAARAATEPLVTAARAAVEAAGHAASLETLRRIRENLHAAAVGSDQLRADLAAGRLSRDLEMPSLLDIAAGLPAPPPAAAPRAPAAPPAAAPAAPSPAAGPPSPSPRNGERVGVRGPGAPPAAPLKPAKSKAAAPQPAAEPAEEPAAPSPRDRARQEAQESARKAQQEERDRARKVREDTERITAIRAADRRVAEKEKALAEAEATAQRARDALDDARAARRRLDP
jgi:hypothetical protein